MSRIPPRKPRTIQIIEAHGRIYLKQGEQYIGQGSQLGWGVGGIVWTRHWTALEFGNLKIAHLLAKYYKCTVVVRYPKEIK